MRTDVDLYRSNLVDHHESQELFRLLLKALSRPGMILRLPDWVTARTIPALTPIIALVSHDVPFSLVGSTIDGLDEALARATAGRLVPVAEAGFVAVLTGGPSEMAHVRVGTPERPDHGCQVGVQLQGQLIVTSFASGVPSDSAVASITLRGPGVAESTSIGYAANIDEVERLGSILSTRRSAPPCGFDMWLFDPHGRVVGVPRTSHVDFHAQITVKGES